MQGREGHFMPPTLLPSQLATLEPLTAEELETGSLRLDITRSPEELIQAILAALKLPSGKAPGAN
jgi:gluconokinase